MTNQLVTVHTDGKLTTTSLIIAQHFKKRHTDVIRSIRNLDCTEQFNERNFASVEYTDSKGEKRPSYCITRDGFMFLVMGFTGKEAAMWKERFINAFNEMEQMLKQQEMTRSILDVLRNKDLKLHIGFDGSLTFKVEEKRDPYTDIANAIRDPSNIGLKEPTIRQVLDACADALQQRAQDRETWGKQLEKRLENGKNTFPHKKQ